MTPVARVDSNAVAQRPAHLVTVRPGQRHVEDDRVEGVLPRHPDAVSAVVHDIDGEPSASSPFRSPAARRCFVSGLRRLLSPERASPPESSCAPTAYAVISDAVAAVAVARFAPLTRCRSADVVPTPNVTYCAATAFAIDATAHAVFADCLAVQRHTAILRTFCEIRCISMHSPLTISGGFLPHHDGAPQAGGTCGAPGGEV